MTRVLVTGAAGFIGSHLVDRLLAEGREVLGVDNFDPFYDRRIKLANLEAAMTHPRFRLLELDIADPNPDPNANISAIEEAVRDFGPDAIAHLAAKAGVRPSLDAPADYARVNVMGTVRLMDAARRLDPLPRFVYASSSSVYGDRGDPPFRETDPVDHPISPYAATKKACELMAHTFHHLYGLPVTGLRFFTAYGPRNRPDLAIAKFADRVERGQPIPMFGDGGAKRDYTYVEDIADGVVRALDRCRTHHLYNLGNSEPIALADMIAAIGAAIGKPPVIERLPEQPGDVRLTCADIARAREELGYAPATPFADGLRKYVEWRRGH